MKINRGKFKKKLSSSNKNTLLLKPKTGVELNLLIKILYY